MSTWILINKRNHIRSCSILLNKDKNTSSIAHLATLKIIKKTGEIKFTGFIYNALKFQSAIPILLLYINICIFGVGLNKFTSWWHFVAH